MEFSYQKNECLTNSGQMLKINFVQLKSGQYYNNTKIFCGR
jgi:hypothetical protein